MTADILALENLYKRVPANIINGYFDDGHTGQVSNDDDRVQEVLMAAEGELYSRVMRAYPGNPSAAGSAIRLLLQNDPTLRMHLEWVACEFACERRPEFTDAQGNGAYKAQYDRAITYFENLSRGVLRSKGEAQAGRGANTGGGISPQVVESNPNFIFAPSKYNPRGSGGF